MTEYQKEIAFLRRAIRVEDTDHRRALEERINQVQRDSVCVQRAVFMTAVPLALTAAAFAYGAVLEENFPFGNHQFVIRILCVVGLTSLISLLAFSGLALVYRLRLNHLREECREVVATFLQRQQPAPGDRHLAEAAPGSRDALEWVTPSGNASANRSVAPEPSTSSC